jgi:hypothetical protein
MTVPDWHAHAEHVDPVVASSTVGPPLLSLLPALTEPVVARGAHRGADRSDAGGSGCSAPGAGLVDRLALLTRVLLGPGSGPSRTVAVAEVVEVVEVADPPPLALVVPLVPVAPVEPVEPVEPVGAAYDVVDLVEASLFVAPPVVEVAPLVADLQAPALPEPEPEPPRDRPSMLDELAFLDR